MGHLPAPPRTTLFVAKFLVFCRRPSSSQRPRRPQHVGTKPPGPREGVGHRFAVGY
jgi:hypothetical protein